MRESHLYNLSSKVTQKHFLSLWNQIIIKLSNHQPTQRTDSNQGPIQPQRDPIKDKSNQWPNQPMDPIKDWSKQGLIKWRPYPTKESSNHGLIQPKTNQTKDWSNQWPIKPRTHPTNYGFNQGPIQPKIDPFKDQSKQR